MPRLDIQYLLTIDCLLSVICRKCFHASHVDPDILKQFLEESTSLSVVEAGLKCQQCGVKNVYTHPVTRVIYEKYIENLKNEKPRTGHLAPPV